MKNFLLIILMLIFVVIGKNYSQNIRLLDESNNDVTNSTITINGPIDQMFQVHLSVKNVSSDTIKVKVRKKDSILVSGAYVMLCWGMCSAPNVNESPLTIPIPGNSINSNSFSGDYYANNNPGTSVVVFTFYNVEDPTDYAKVIVKFNAQASFVNEHNPKVTKFSNPLPNPASDYVRFYYTLSKDVITAKIAIYDLLGNFICEKSCTEQEGQLIIPLDEIENGVYFYTIYINDKIVSSRKLIVKH